MRQRRSELVVGAVLTAVVWAATAVYALVSPGMRERGLLPEPERTTGGYRTYDADAVIRLTKITTLAWSGVPLARIEGLLAADPETFRDGVAEIDRDLEQRIRELQRDREQVDGWVAEFGCTIAHSEYVALQARTLQLHDVPPEDPAVTKVADAWVEWTAAHWAEHEASWDTQLSDPLADSIVASRWVSTAAWDRMGELIAAGLHARGLDHPALASHL